MSEHLHSGILSHPILPSQKVTLSTIQYNFTIQHIKIIFLHNKIIYPKTQIKTKTQITSAITCYHHHHKEHTQTETHGHATTLRQKSKEMKPISTTMKPTFATTTRDTTMATTHLPPPCKETHKKKKKKSIQNPNQDHWKLISTPPPVLSPLPRPHARSIPSHNHGPTPPLHHHDPKPTPTNQNPTPTPPEPITIHPTTQINPNQANPHKTRLTHHHRPPQNHQPKPTPPLTIDH